MFIQIFWPKKLNKNKKQCLFVFKNKINDTIFKIIANFSKTDENLGKNSGKCEEKQREFTLLFSEV